MQKKTEVQQELKRMREICDKEVIVVSDFSSKSKKKLEVITISDSSHSSKREQKEKKLENCKNHKNSQILKDILEIETQKAPNSRENRPQKPEKSENWLNYQSKIKEKVSKEEKKRPNKPKYSDKMHISLYPRSDTFRGVTPVVSLDCEMVLSIAKHEIKEKHEIGRVSIVNYNGHILFDEFIRPKNRIVNYLTWVSGITYDKIKNCATFDTFKEKIFSLLVGKTVVGHTLESDFEALNFDAKLSKKRDLKTYKFLQEDGKILSLKKMCDKFLKIKIQTGQHNPVEDARAALMIYRTFEKRIENETKNWNYEDVKGRFLKEIKSN